MAWEARNIVSLRKEFVSLASQDGSNMALLCRRFGISRPTGYKWLCRFRESVAEKFENRSTRPHSSPLKTDAAMESRVIELRRKHPMRGARTIGRMLLNSGGESLAPSTINSIFRRNGLIEPDESSKHQAFTRFEKAAPNELWQMDYKGHFALDQGRCHPLTVIDDHSRYAVGLFACGNERTETVREHLTAIFRRYGLPRAILCDNGSPWGSAGAEDAYTKLAVWLMQLGVHVLHGKPHHPQTQGKNERFNRTLKAETLQQRYEDLRGCQERFEKWRQEYNWERPHHALNLEVPGARYRPSARAFPETLPEPEYTGTNLEVRCVHNNGSIMIGKKRSKIGLAFAGLKVAIERSTIKDVWTVRFYGQIIKTLDRRSVQ